MKIGERTEAEMKRRVWSEAELARRASIPQPTVHRIIKGESKSPRQDNIQAIAKAFGCSAEWLWTGNGKAPSGIEDGTDQPQTSAANIVFEMLKKHGKGLTEEAQQKICTAVEKSLSEANSNVVTGDFARPARLTDGDVLIPQYDVRASMGHGQVPADYVDFVRNVVVDGPQLERLGLEYTSPANLSIITGWGQSMEGTINDKDPVIVDRGVTEFSGDGVYVLTWAGDLYIKRLQKADAERFDMISDNEKHKDRTVLMEEVTIHAKVLLVWNAKKL
jgi:phage repressor protein C with HTH and peptisase S24 domain